MKKIKSEITTLVLMMIVVFELLVITTKCFYETDYLWGSIWTIETIVVATVTYCQKRKINQLVDEMNTEDVIVISK